MTGSVDIVIVNWNTGPHLRDCLVSIADMRAGPPIRRVTVVDNASSDDSLDRLQELPLPLEIVSNSANRGFAAACNQGASDTTAAYLLFVNPDTRFFPDTLATVTRFMESPQSADVGICGVQMVAGDGTPKTSCARFPTLRVLLGEMTGLSRVVPRAFPSHQMSAADLRESQFVDQVIGAFFLVRRPLFAALGGFDERYFLYFEEVDFALRARHRGARSYFLMEASVYHAEHVSSDQIRGIRLYHILRSRLLFAYKHWPRWQADMLLIMTLTAELIARVRRDVAARNRLDIIATLSAYRTLVGDFVRGRSPRSYPRCQRRWANVPS
jgi:N-acetylglucosaminyl-diphospho-decaprenol L-rhamnosyltransferase